jgi:hypothetical protein
MDNHDRFGCRHIPGNVHSSVGGDGRFGGGGVAQDPDPSRRIFSGVFFLEAAKLQTRRERRKPTNQL